MHCWMETGHCTVEDSAGRIIRGFRKDTIEAGSDKEAQELSKKRINRHQRHQKHRWHCGQKSKLVGGISRKMTIMMTMVRMTLRRELVKRTEDNLKTP